MNNMLRYKIQTTAVINAKNEPAVRIHIIDPGGQDGRWIELTLADAMVHLTSVSEAVQTLMGPAKTNAERKDEDHH